MFHVALPAPQVGEGLGYGELEEGHLLDNFAVCCRNIATCIVDVASHHIVGEVRLQNNVLWVHVHLKKERNRRKRDLVMRLCFTWSPGKAERQTGRHRGARERETGRWRETMRDQETQRHTDGETERGMKREAAYSQRKHCWVILLGRQVSPESEPRPGGLARGIQSHCPREPSSE